MKTATSISAVGGVERLHWLRLIRTPNVGRVTFDELLRRCGSAQAAIDQLPRLMRAGGARAAPRIPSLADAEAEQARIERHGARLVLLGDPDYPALLHEVENAPPVLVVKGDGAVFARPAIAIVGARNASALGMKMAAALAAEFGRAGYAVVSGLARGIDTAAHRGSLATGTIGALAGGLDRPYPPENVPLCDAIPAEGGAVVTEMPMGWEPRAQDFPRRNRLIAGMAQGLVVVEAAFRSGSLISARLAGEMNRLVFAVPGSPLDPRAAGANGLLKQGAILVTEAADVLDALRPLASGNRAAAHREAGVLRQPAGAFDGVAEDVAEPAQQDERERVLQALSPAPTSLDDLIRFSGVPAARLSLVLLELDLAGRLERHGGGGVSLLVPGP